MASKPNKTSPPAQKKESPSRKSETPPKKTGSPSKEGTPPKRADTPPKKTDTPETEHKPRTTPYNLTALYRFIDTKKDAPGTLWTRKVIELANKLQKEVNDYNELELLKSRAGKYPAGSAQGKAISDRIKVLEAKVKNLKPGGHYKVPDIYGCSQQVKFFDDRPERLFLTFKGPVELSTLFNDKNEIDASNSKHHLCYLEKKEFSRHQTHLECQHKDPPWKFWKTSWETGTWKNEEGKFWGKIGSESVSSGVVYLWRDPKNLKADRASEITRKEEHVHKIWKTLSHKLNTMIHKHAEQLKDVDKVICFALGEPSYTRPTSYVQHLAARTIAHSLEEIHKKRGNPKKINVLAQDVAYCSGCTKVLHDELNIQTITDLEGYFKVDKNTFVVCLCPSGPIPTIIVDMTRGVGGPAAMLCDEINKEYLRPEHVHRERPWIDATETRQLVEWMEKCTGEPGEEFGDASHYMKIRYEDFDTRFPNVPVRMPDTSAEEKKEKAIAQVAYSGKASCNFRDAWLYVRKR
jgi:hypothetical protein